MPELELHKIQKSFGAARTASIAYGNELIEDNSPDVYKYSPEWYTSLYQPQPVAHYRITPTVNQEEQDTPISDWSKNEDPFTQVDLLIGEEKKVQELIFRTRSSLSIPYRQSLANRLLTLFNDAKEEDPASFGIAVGSLRNFYSFLRLHTNLKCPIITLTPDYDIYASWRSEQNRVFSVHFLPNGDVHFVIFKPNYRHSERQIRISGTATTDTLMETVTPNGLWDWIAE